MADSVDASRQNVERILEEGVQDGADRKALRQYLISAESGRGNSLFHEKTAGIVHKIRRVLDVRVPDTRTVEQRTHDTLTELRQRRERGEVSPFDLDLNGVVQVMETRLPLMRRDMLHESGPQALVLVRQSFEAIGTLDFMHTSGERMFIESESVHPKGVFILYPREVMDAASVRQPVPKPAEADVEAGPARMRAIVAEIFPQETSSEPLEMHPEWEAIVAKSGDYLFQTVSQARQKVVPEEYIRRFVFARLVRQLEERKYGMVARQLRNMEFGNDAQWAELDRLATPLDIEVESEKRSNRRLALARELIESFFHDVPLQEALAIQLPDFWNSLTPEMRTFPAGVIIDGRKSGIPELHLRRFAAEAIEVKLADRDYRWVTRFLSNMGLGNADGIKFLLQLAEEEQKEAKKV